MGVALPNPPEVHEPSVDGAPRTSVGQRIAAARRSNGLTQTELADRLDVPLGVLSRYEDDEAEVPTPALAAIAAQTDVSVSWLRQGVEDEVLDVVRTLYEEVVRNLYDEVERLTAKVESLEARLKRRRPLLLR